MLPTYSEQSQKGQLKTCRQTYLVCDVKKKDKTFKKKEYCSYLNYNKNFIVLFSYNVYISFVGIMRPKPTFKLGKRSKRIKTRRDVSNMNIQRRCHLGSKPKMNYLIE